MKKVTFFWLFILVFSLCSCGNKIDYQGQNKAKIHDEKLDLYDYVVFVEKGTKIVLENKNIKVNKQLPARIVNYNFYEGNAEIEIIEGKNKGKRGKCPVNNLNFNSDILYYCNKCFLETDDLLVHIKLNVISNWKMSEILDYLNYFYNSREVIVPIFLKYKVFSLINFVKICDYDNINFNDCILPELLIKTDVVEINKLDNKLINAKYGLDGNTLLIYAIINNKNEIIQELIENNADPEIKNNNEKSAIDYALNEKNLKYLVNSKKRNNSTEINPEKFNEILINWKKYFNTENYQFDNFFWELKNDEIESKYKINKKQIFYKENDSKLNEIIEKRNKYFSENGTSLPYSVYKFDETAYVNDHTYMININCEKVELHPGEEVQVLYTYPLEDKDNFYSITSGKLNCPFVLICNSSGETGIISSYQLAHIKTEEAPIWKAQTYLLISLYECLPVQEQEKGNIVVGSIYLIEDRGDIDCKIIHNPYTIELTEKNSFGELKLGDKYLYSVFTREFEDYESNILFEYMMFCIVDNVLIKYGDFNIYNNLAKNYSSSFRLYNKGQTVEIYRGTKDNGETYNFDDNFNLIQ